MSIEDHVIQLLNDKFKRHNIRKHSTIASLWSGYGELARYEIDSDKTVIAKTVLNQIQQHPKGWQGQQSHNRKMSSYRNEHHFYRDFANLADENCYVPAHILTDISNQTQQGEMLTLVLEDLDGIGYNSRHEEISLVQAKTCIRWLAHFHAKFIQIPTPSLWQKGTYWYLETRSEEYAAMTSSPLKTMASKIDQMLNNARYQTLLHGDAKLANFCFDDKKERVSAVDFQYCGRGVGVRDLCYFIGSCWFDDSLYKAEPILKNYYFRELSDALIGKDVATEPLIKEWHALYTLCWADFERFLAGWSPEHKKCTAFSRDKTQQALSMLNA